jgi:proteasome lid subunit RPN8/RPN11
MDLSAALATMRAHAERAWPLECVGALVGDGEAVREARPLPNVAADPSRGFEVPARALLDLERSVDAAGMRVWGTYHSHPDGPALPSGADLAFGSPGRWMVIIPVEGGKAGEPRAWRWGEDGRLEGAFATLP